MNFQTLLGVYHYCVAHHTGMMSREYRIMCRIQKDLTVRGTHEYLACLAQEENQEAREVYVRLAASAAPESGYSSCACCEHAIFVSDILAESGVTMCHYCVAHDCNPVHGPCVWEEELDS